VCLICAWGPIEPAAATARGPFPAEPEPFPLQGADALGLTAMWTGVAGLVLERDGVRIAFDPFVSRPGLAATLFRAPRSDGELVARTFPALDAVFVGHAHHDHAQDLPAVAAASPRARLVGGPTALELCRRQGVPDARLLEAEDGTRVEVGPFVVEAIGSVHGHVPWVGLVDRLTLGERGLPRTPFRFPRGEVFAWRVEVGGRAIHVQGSAGLLDVPLLRQRPADVLVACLAARKGTPRYLERLGEVLRPRVLVPAHHDDFFRPLAEAPRPIATLRWSAFLDEAHALERTHGTRLWRPTRLVPAPW
jgi:L-ascorbate metabolism protein UlaG (beta-lactamase superfamily)